MKKDSNIKFISSDELLEMGANMLNKGEVEINNIDDLVKLNALLALMERLQGR